MTVPYVAVQAVALAEVNCCVAPRFNETVEGEIVCGFVACGACSVTAAEAEPPGPVAVTVTELDDGMTEGAVNRPLVLIVPAVAAQPVAADEVNCRVAPSFTVAAVGEMVCCEGGGGGVGDGLLVAKVALKAGPHRVPGFST